MRYIVPNTLIDHFGGCLEPKKVSRDYYATGTGDKPVIVKYRRNSRRQYFALMGRRSTEPSETELGRRQLFADIAKEIARQRADAETHAQNLLLFRQQSTYKTFRAYMWSRTKVELSTPSPTE